MIAYLSYQKDPSSLNKYHHRLNYFYLEMLCEHRLHTAVRPQVEASLKGFHTIVPEEVWQSISRLLSPDELVLLLSGTQTLQEHYPLGALVCQRFPSASPSRRLLRGYLYGFSITGGLLWTPSWGGEEPCRLCIIIDEAHRGLTDDRVYIKSVLKRFRSGQF
jgi:hypothetical protein